jgi:hypothetical protein
VQPLDQAAKNSLFSLKHLFPEPYKVYKIAKARGSVCGRAFPFYTFLEFVAFSLPVGDFKGATGKKLLALQMLSFRLPLAGPELSMPPPSRSTPFFKGGFMTEKLLALLGLLFLFSVSARAQHSVDLFGGYSYQALDRLPRAIPGRDLEGVEISARYGLRDWLGVVGEVDGHWGLPSFYAARSLNILAGPQISLPRRISPFAHALIGYGHGYTRGIWDNSFSASLGGGIDLRIAPLLSWRILEADDVIAHYFGGTEHNLKASTGIVLRF